MKLHEDKNVFLEFIQKTSKDLGIQQIYIEKDYWVVYILKTLSLWDTQKTVVFKGGTSLSKAYKVIDRFSEDVDLVLKDTSMNSSQIKKKLKEVHEKSVISPLRAEETPRTSKGSRFRKVDYKYPQALGDYDDIGDASEKLLVELNSFGNPFPVVSKSVRTYISDMLEKAPDGDKHIKKYELEPVSVEVLDWTRTFCEKVMGLLRVSLKENYLDEHRSRVRHFYDITKLLENAEIQDFLKSENVTNVIEEIYKSDLTSLEFKGDWTSADLSQNPLFTKTDEILNHIEYHFNTQFRKLLYIREKFEFNKIKESIGQLRSRLSVSI